MATKTVVWKSSELLNCYCGGDVILCVDAALTVSGAPYIDATVDSTVCGADTCGKPQYSYYISYDDTQLLNPSIPLYAIDIEGAYCKDCLLDYLTYQIGEVATGPQGPVGPQGPAGTGSDDAWLLLGNAGTVDGVNFLGTTDNVAHDIRVNNTRARRTVPALAYTVGLTQYESAPQLIDGFRLNSVSAGEKGSSILSGGILAYPNTIAGYTGVPTIAYDSCNLICGGAGSRFTGIDIEESIINSVIVAGFYNEIGFTDSPPIYPPDSKGDYVIQDSFVGGGYSNGVFGNNYFSAVVGGELNWIMALVDWTGENPVFIEESWANFIGGGDANYIEGSYTSTIAGCEGNHIVLSYAGVICGGSINELGTETPATAYFTNSYNNYYNFIGAGYDNFIELTESCGIVVGSDNIITSSDTRTPVFRKDSCAILGGYFNKIDTNPSDSASIFGLSSILGGMALYVGARTVGFQLSQTPAITNNPPDPTYTDLTAYSDLFYCGNADLWIGNVDNTARKLKLFEPNTDVDFSSAHYSSLESQAQSANIEYKMPAAAGSVGQVLKIQGVAGTVVTLEWANDLT